MDKAMVTKTEDMENTILKLKAQLEFLENSLNDINWRDDVLKSKLNMSLNQVESMYNTMSEKIIKLQETVETSALDLKKNTLDEIKTLQNGIKRQINDTIKTSGEEMTLLINETSMKVYNQKKELEDIHKKYAEVINQLKKEIETAEKKEKKIEKINYITVAVNAGILLISIILLFIK